MTKLTVDDYLNDVDYTFEGYVPSIPALEFVNFIKLVNGDAGEENKTPVVHMQLLDNIFSAKNRLAILCHRGFAKSTLLSEYLPLFCAVYGKLENFGEITYMLFIGDSMENGCRNMRRNMENRYNTSEFLQQYLPKARFTDAIIEFTNKEGKQFAIRLAGAQQSIRGTRYLNKRPELCVMDDILTDEDARSTTCINKVKDTIHKGVAKALHPTKNKIIYVGTVFNTNDPLYETIESGRWSPSVYPVCEKFPCSKEEFKGSWEDRFPYEAVYEMYQDAIALGRIQDFNGEMMNRITSDESRMILDGDIKWYSRSTLMERRDIFNFYITTDFATSEKQSADYSVIAVWALNNQGYWFLVDGVCKRQGMGENIDDLFRLAQMYNPQLVGVEVTGQQGGFIPWIQQEMMKRNIWFNLASDNNSNQAGIRPNTNKMQRFNTVVPWFKQGIMFFPEEYKKDHALTVEMVSELCLSTYEGFKSKHDDCIDVVSMLSVLKAWKPSEQATLVQNTSTDMWALDDGDELPESMTSYIV
jgi:predicted phage terminase large subunit-like protein